MAIVAYYGRPGERIFGRVTFSSMDQALIACWHDSSLYGLHNTDDEETWLDRIWLDGAGDAPAPAEKPGQLWLFDAALADGEEA